MSARSRQMRRMLDDQWQDFDQAIDEAVTDLSEAASLGGQLLDAATGPQAQPDRRQQQQQPQTVAERQLAAFREARGPKGFEVPRRQGRR